MVSSAGSALARCSRTTTLPAPGSSATIWIWSPRYIFVMTSASAEFAVAAEAPGHSHDALGPDADAHAGALDRPAAAPHHDPRAHVHGVSAVSRLHHVAGQEVHVPDEVSHERRERPVVDRARLVELLDDAVGHDRHPVGHGQRLALVVGDVDEGDPHLVLDAFQLDLHLLAELQVERAERLVEQQHARAHDQGPGPGHALLLAAGQHAGPVRLPAGHLHQLERLACPGVALGLADLALLEP